MKHYLKIRIKTIKHQDCLMKLSNLKVDIKNIIYENNYLIGEIKKEDLKRVKKYLISFKIEVLDETGIFKLKKECLKNSLFLNSLLFGIIIFLVLSNVIVKVNIIHNKKEIRDLLIEALKERGVTALSFKKNYQEYENIIKEIKNEYKNRLEWLEIEVDGMIINIRVQERITSDFTKEYNTCHVVAKKAGIIKNMQIEKGIAVKTFNDYINKDDILISGEISLNEEVKNNVCAKGLVYAEVWYNINIKLPLNYEEKIRTGKWRYNLTFKNNYKEYPILKSRIKDKEITKQQLLSFKEIAFYLAKEYEINILPKKYTETEAIKKAQELMQDKLLMNNKITKIITEKVLQKSVINDTLNMDIFVAVNEEIGKTVYYTVEESDTNDESNNGYYNTGY